MKTGRIFGIFPVEITEEEGVTLRDCWINNNFMWLFDFLNEIEGLASSLVGVDHLFMIKLDKEEKVDNTKNNKKQ